MSLDHLDELPTEKIIQEFVNVARRRGSAVLNSETRTANRMFDRMRAIDQVLRRRGHDARMALLPLLKDEDRSVRYYAAKYMLGVTPATARQVIEAIAAINFDALSGDAGMCLDALDDGIFRPD